MTESHTPEVVPPVSLERLKSDFEAIVQLKDQTERARRWAIFEQQLRDLQTSLSDQYNEGLELLKKRYATLQQQGFIAAGSEVAQDSLSVGGNVLDAAGSFLASQGAEFQKSAENENKGFFRKVGRGFWTALKVLGIFTLASKAVNYFGPSEVRATKSAPADTPPEPPKPATPPKEPAQRDAPKKNPVAAPTANSPQVKAPEADSKPKEPSSPVETEKDGWKFGEHRMCLVERSGKKFLTVNGRVFHTNYIGFLGKTDVSGNILGVERRSDGGMHIRYTIPLLGERIADVSHAECVKAAETLANARGAVSLTLQTTENGKKKERSFECTPE